MFRGKDPSWRAVVPGRENDGERAVGDDPDDLTRALAESGYARMDDGDDDDAPSTSSERDAYVTDIEDDEDDEMNGRAGDVSDSEDDAVYSDALEDVEGRYGRGGGREAGDVLVLLFSPFPAFPQGGKGVVLRCSDRLRANGG